MRKSFRRVAGVVATLSLVMACTEVTILTPPGTPVPIGSGSVGTSGGEVTSTDGKTAKVEVPAGALTSVSEVTIAVVQKPPQIDGTVAAGPTVELGPEGLSFQE